ncbi:hypothetical protein Pan97_45570 [Bremerella volcania]|uniref:Uncharacterized protein n=1 Tax=Bremerella volcania TaxID=2527984 RepID=A0A518CE40_9BACT|nr:hypothetical protein [Bremerella volcania]QDU77487.1 hypothetical protein Pan97_45570 [Bremerella volcania]
MKTILSLILIMALSLVSLGCNRSSGDSNEARNDGAPSPEMAKYLLASEPEGAQEVIAVRESAKDDEDVTIVGRIGGSANPWVEGRAAFSIVDPSLKACNDIPGDACEKPWDYCCETDKLPGATALVKVVDENGEVLKADARQSLKLDELQTVVVRGKAKRDAEGNLTVLANSLYVRK